MLGQSNMLGEGHIGNLSAPVKNDLANAVAVEGKYPYLYDKATKNWTTSKTVRNVFVLGSGGPNGKYGSKVMTDEWMTGPNFRHSIGPELGIGGMLEAANPTTPYLMLKSCIGDRALGWDLLPPGTKRESYTDTAGTVWTYAGYHDSPEKWVANKTQPPPIGWYAGEQYDGDIFRANGVLSNLSTFYPSTPPQKCYEVAGCESLSMLLSSSVPTPAGCPIPAGCIPLLPSQHASDPFLSLR
jgi:alpha-galactosidase